MGTFGGWGEQTKKILQVIFEFTAERDNIPYHIATNMIRRRLQAHLMNWIGADLRQRHNTQTAISSLNYTHSNN